MNIEKPEFPITFKWLQTGEVEVYDSLREIECNVEHFDSRDGEASVTDALGRPVRILIDLLSAEVFDLE